MKNLILLVVAITSSFAFAAAKPKPKAEQKPVIDYWSCAVKEGRTDVTVKFAVQGYDYWKEAGTLLVYPGADEEYGAILVEPRESATGRYTAMTNLNGQGGDLRVEGSNIRLWGDGDGYQFTELVIWDASDEGPDYEGYVRDYGPAYGNKPIFKQFIKCRKTDKPL